MSDRSQRLEELFATALELEAGQRSAFLDRECGGDADLRRELEELLAADAEAGDYFEDLLGDIAAAAPLELESAARVNVRIGPYRTVRVVGQGGMGVVYLAVRDDGEFDREVALKLLHLDMDTPAARARFLAERQLLARLSHPGIAHLLDGGVTDEGRPYFVMDFVEGVPISRYCREEALGLEAILRLFLDVVDAVAYLHRNLIVHRDLKPGNVFVDREGEVKLLDFGIAKLLAEDPSLVGRTRTGQQLLTPEYAAPEQMTGDPVTTATDVYALGGLLFELLTGRRPFERTAMAPSEIRDQVPAAPSSMLKAARAQAGDPGGSAALASGATISWRRLAGDLDTICLKALHPRPELRYASAEQLAQDIERYLEGLPVHARRSTLAYRASRFARRHRRGLVLAFALLLLLVLGFLRESSLREEAESARMAADREAAKAVAVSDFLGELLSSVDPAKARGEEVTVAEVLDQASERLGEGAAFADQPAVEAAVRLTLGTTYEALSRFDASLEHLERAVELEGGREATTPEALEAMFALSVLHTRRGEPEQAEELARRVLEVRSETLGEEHPDTLEALNQLAGALWAQRRYEEVEPLDRRTLAARRRLFGPEHPDTLQSMNGLAATLFYAGRYADAGELFAEVFAVRTRLLGEEHPDTLLAGSNLGACEMERGRYPEAEELLRRVLEVRRRVLDRDDPLTWTSAHNLALTLFLRARYDEAEDLLRQVIDYRRRMPGEKAALYVSQSYLADLVRDRERFEEAEELYLDTLARVRESWGDEDSTALKTASGLAELRLRQGRPDEAEALITRVLDSIAAVVGSQHPDALGSLIILARVRNAQGRHDEALERSEEVLALAEAAPAFDAEHPLVLEALTEKVLALRGLGRLEEAAALAPGIHEARMSRLGGSHPATAAARRLAIGILEAAGEDVEAAQLRDLPQPGSWPAARP